MRLWWADSRGKIILTLLVLWAAAQVREPKITFFLSVFVALVLNVVLDTVIAKIRYRIWFVSPSSVVTGLLIGLIADPTSVLYGAVASVIAVASKHFLGMGRQKHIFNPAALGIVVSAAIFGRPVSWWGGAWGIVPLGIIVIGTLLTLKKLGRIWAPATFLIVYFFNSLLFSDLSGALRLTFDGTVFLFALVMLTEPITSVNKTSWRYGWGVGVGVLVILQTLVKSAIADPLLLALLTANLVGFFLVRRPRARPI